MKQTRRFLLVVAVIVAVMGIYLFRSGGSGRREQITYNENLDKAVAIVDGDELLLRDLAVYIAYEEGVVEEHAIVYDETDTGRFWRSFTDRGFLSSLAKDNIIAMAIHDTIFYELSRTDGIQLSEEELKAAEDVQTDFWSDLKEEQKEALGVEKEEIDEAIQRIALAEKYQTVLAMADEKEFEEYSFTGDAYQRLLEDHEYEIYEEVLDKLRIGGITLNH